MLAAVGLQAAEAESRWIVEAAAGRSLAELADLEVNALTEDHALGLAERRAAGEPLQYVTGVAGFRRLDLAVGPGTLIPRPETELVAERAMELLPQGGTVVDVGTGSGCIALSIADERPDARVVATDNDSAALAWAARNRAALRAEVALVACDLLEGLPGDLRRHVDVVVSNPPYVAEHEAGTLPAEVLEHEPHSALFAGDGLDVIRRLVDEARTWLRPGGWLVLEIAPPHAGAVEALLDESGFNRVKVGADLTGRPRVIEAGWGV